jgi:hypothetical protein
VAVGVRAADQSVRLYDRNLFSIIVAIVIVVIGVTIAVIVL